MIVSSSLTGVFLLLVQAILLPSIHSFQAARSSPRLARTAPRSHHALQVISTKPPPVSSPPSTLYQPKGVLLDEMLKSGNNDNTNHQNVMQTNLHRQIIAPAAIATAAIWATLPAPAMAAAGPVPSAAFAWLHFVGIMGVAGGLMTERFLIKPNMSEEESILITNADGIYGLSALSLLISGYFRVTEYAKGWDYYKNEPIFWLKMSSVAILGALSFFPTIIFVRRDLARKEGQTLVPLSDAIVERITTIINAEILALLTIPFLASLMARGVLYWQDFPWAIGVAVYAVSLGGAGFKYGKEAFDIMEQEGALNSLEEGSSD